MTLVLLHGLGATRDVWRGITGIAPDLPGHGTAAWEAPYSFERHATAVLPLLPDEPVTVVGHSMGGVVGLVLAALAPDHVRHVVALGVKVTWSDADVARAASLAQRPVVRFATREEAVDRFLKVSGLVGLIRPDDPMSARAVVVEGGGWRLAQDPRTFAVGVPAMPDLLAAAGCPVTLARGEHDGLVSHDQLEELVPDPVTLSGLGHNAHVEDPAAVLRLVEGVTI